MELDRQNKLSSLEDINRFKQREIDHKIQNKKIISKINHNSQRIIETNQIQRTLQKINEEILKQQEEDVIASASKVRKEVF